MPFARALKPYGPTRAIKIDQFPQFCLNQEDTVMIGLLLLSLGMLFAIPAIAVGIRPNPPVDAFYGRVR